MSCRRIGESRPMADDRTAAGGCRCDDCAIRRTLARYNIAGDRGDLPGLAAAFTEDGVLHAPGIHVTGRAAIVARLELAMAGHNPALIRVQHNLPTSFVEIKGESSTLGRRYFVGVSDIGPDHAATYHDRLLRQDGEWLIAE